MKKNILRKGALAIAVLLLTSSVANAQSTPNKRELIYQVLDQSRPYDKSISEHAHKIAPINILHVCDYGSSYKDQATLEGYADYPTSIINPPVNLEKGTVDLKHLQKAFNRPVFGGLDRLGVLVTGSIDEAKKEVDRILENAPDNFILGADCTVPSETDYARLREIIDYAHNWRKTHKK